MSVTVAGPYEHRGQYVDGEFWDITGTPPGFCKSCEHAPCVGGGRNFCTMQPREIVSAKLRREISGCLDHLATYPRHPYERLLSLAVFGLSVNPSKRDLLDLARIRDDLRKLAD